MIGMVGLVAAGVASFQVSESDWLMVWLLAAVVSLGIGVVSIWMKAKRLGIPVLGGAGRKFAYGLAPAFFSGALLTAVLYDAGLAHYLPAVWLLLYGAAIVAAGIHSIGLIRLLGVALMFLGTAAFFAPVAWGDALLAAGFGMCHVLTGAAIIRRYGG